MRILFSVLGLLAGVHSAPAQQVQTNNRGVIVNVGTPAYPQPTDAQVLQQVLDRPTTVTSAPDINAVLSSSQRYRLDHPPAGAVTTLTYFVQSATTGRTGLRAYQDLAAAPLVVLRAGTPLSVDQRRGGVLPGWSAVRWHRVDGEQVRTLQGFVETKYLR